MDQTDTILDELTRNGRIAYRRLGRAGASNQDLCFFESTARTGDVAGMKEQLKVEFRLRRTAPWATHPLRTAALESHLAALLRAASLSTQQTLTSPPPTA